MIAGKCKKCKQLVKTEPTFPCDHIPCKRGDCPFKQCAASSTSEKK